MHFFEIFENLTCFHENWLRALAIEVSALKGHATRKTAYAITYPIQ